jgi:hypothetical protein
MPPFRVGPLVAPSKTAALAAARRINAKAPLRRILEGKAADLMRGVLDLRADAAEKLAFGFRGICVRTNCYGGNLTRGPHVVPDATEVVEIEGGREVPFGAPTIPFGLNDALSATDRVPEAQVRSLLTRAGRAAVLPSVLAYRHARFDASVATCDKTGVPLTADEAAVDHADPWPFARILAEFLATLADVPEVRLGHRFDGDVCHVEHSFADPAVAVAFRDFHDRVARLRLLHRSVNGPRAASGKGWW